MRGVGRLLALLVCFSSLPLAAQSSSSAPALTVAAASDLAVVIKEISTAFEKQTGIKTKISTGSSGNFFAQIANGAPFDVFLSADEDYPRRLVAAGVADKDSLYVYGTGHLVLWIRNASLDLKREGLQALVKPSIHKIAIANPDHAPYGRAAVAALHHAGVYEQVKSKLVLGENISQTAQFVESGNADAGIVSVSLTKGMNPAGAFVDVPAGSYPPIQQAAVIVNSTKNRRAAEAFIKYLKSDECKALLQRYGFGVPPEKP
jgi:molybdate transport system substrate-binding protein